MLILIKFYDSYTKPNANFIQNEHHLDATTTPTVIINASIHNILHTFFIITVIIRKNVTVGKLEKLQKVFTIKFYLFPASIPGGSWKNVIHFTQDSECCEIGARVPALFYRTGTSGRLLRFISSGWGCYMGECWNYK